MDNISGVLNMCVKALREITTQVKGRDLGRLPVIYGPGMQDDDFTVSLGDFYAERFFSCVTPSLRITLTKDSQPPAPELSRLSSTATGDGNDILPAWSADPGLTDTLFDYLKLYKRPTPETIRKYAAMSAEKFTAALVDVITGKGRGALEADAVNWRCVYAGYIYLQVDEYLRDQTAAFVQVPQSKATNALVKINSGELDVDKLTRRSTITVQDTVFEIAGYSGKLSTGAMILFDIFLHESRRTGSASISIPLTDLARMKGRSTSKPALDKLRAETIKQMDELSPIHYRGRSKVKGKWNESGKIHINGGTAIIVNSEVRWNFNQDFSADVTHLAPMDYPRELWKVDPRTNQFFFGRYIAQNYRLNEEKPGRQRIRIRTLIEQSPNLPSYAAVMSGDRRVKDRIIAKTFKDLDALGSIFYKVYTADGREVLCPDSLDYNTFINAYIEIDYSDFPTHAPRINAKQQRTKRAKAAAERRQAQSAAKMLENQK